MRKRVRRRYWRSSGGLSWRLWQPLWDVCIALCGEPLRCVYRDRGRSKTVLSARQRASREGPVGGGLGEAVGWGWVLSHSEPSLRGRETSGALQAKRGAHLLQSFPVTSLATVPGRDCCEDCDSPWLGLVAGKMMRKWAAFLPTLKLRSAKPSCLVCTCGNSDTLSQLCDYHYALGIGDFIRAKCSQGPLSPIPACPTLNTDLFSVP